MKRFGFAATLIGFAIETCSFAARADHWALRPIEQRPTPSVTDSVWVQTPVDRFVLQKLESEAMRPSPPATKPVLLRRVYYDLIGLPPTPEEQDRFLADRSPIAFAEVVERLLDRPEYGERWARHWLDVAHYAESHGHDQDRVRTNSWPYRDYVISSFNADKPYARFVEEQIAGDTLFPDDPTATVAMGFLATGPWDESSLRDIREDSIDRQIARYIDRDDIVSTVMNTFVSTSVQCARCHDHKFDPVSQKEYYSLQAVFAGTEKANRFFDSDPKTHRLRQTLLARKQQLETPDDAIRKELNALAFRDRVASWEESLRKESALWTILAPNHAASTNHATLSIRSDNSIVSEGKRPDTDTYFVRASTPESVAAIRLETLRDDSISTGGPGRQENGNFHLTDLGVFTMGEDGVEEPVRLSNAIADFNQEGWDVARAIDDDPKTGWGIFPAIGQSHAAVFTTATNLPAGTQLKFVLAQNHGGGHLIKRFRLSITSTQPPKTIRLFPDAISRALLAGSERTPEQHVELALFLARRETQSQLDALPAPSLVFAGAHNFVPDATHKPIRGARPVHLLKRGDIQKPGDLAVPAALGFLPNLPADFSLGPDCDESLRRAALARWITDPRNALTWRSIVNRVWHYHFGRGLVSTPNDFGKMGGAPSHPELLDWLAGWFIENGGHLKDLHRLLLNSAVYQQSTVDEPAFSARDADNVFLWRMNRARLDAESMRDSILAISGNLRLHMGGPSDQHFLMKPGIHVTPQVNYASFDVDSATSQRRSIYRFIFRTLPDPLMDVLDCPDASLLTPARNNSVTASQALALWNDRFNLRYSEHLATRLTREEPANLSAQVRLACRLVWCREPSQAEIEQFALFVRDYNLPAFCRVLLNSNEFIFLN